MVKDFIQKYRLGGIHAIRRAVIRKLSPPRNASHHLELDGTTPHPVLRALDIVTSQDGFCVIQLGAFIGNTGNDPLYEMLTKRLYQFAGKLIVVEPVKSFFKILVRNYDGIQGVAFENVAISDRNGAAWFYRLGVDPALHGQPEFLSQLGSLKKERMESLWDNYENMVECQDFYLKHRVKEEVNCITFTELLRRHGILKVDLLQIDVEGYEFEILRTIDFRKCPIRFINYESVLLQSNENNAEELMLENGYRFVKHGQDTFCYKQPDEHLVGPPA